MLTVDQIKAILKDHLRSFNRGQPVSDDTVFSSILSDTDGFTTATSSKRIYKALVRFSLANNNHQDIAWPSNWMDKTVAELADVLAAV
jgi:hypothetical protein